MTRASEKFLKDETGVAAIEAALTIPVLLALGLGGVEFSNAFLDHQQISTGVRDAARYLARVEDPTDATAQANAKDIAVNGAVGGSMPRIAGWTTGSVSVATTSISNPVVADTGERTYRGPDTIYVVTVSTSVAYPQIGLLGGLGLAAPTFAISHSERSIGE
jgi:Flp pilus assembly protein TadG